MADKENAKPRRKRGAGCAVLLAFAAAAALALTLAAVVDSAPPGENGPPSRVFVVPRGSSAWAISRRLEAGGFIRSADFFTLYLKASGRGGGLQAGPYAFPAGIDTRGVARMMLEGKQALRRVTVPEGYTLRDMAPILEDAGVCGAKEFLAAAADPALLAELGLPGRTAEGYAFPDTYELPILSEPATVLRTMVARFFAVIAERFPESAGMDAEKLSEVVILASIVEREYRLPEEAPRIAGVFRNRLKIGMGLQSCATVVYIKTVIMGEDHPGALRVEDLAVKDPYNTYLWAGLPPGPISNPGPVALAAAFRPEEHDYLYFRLTDPARGAHTFTRSLDEHIEAGSIPVKGKGRSR